MPENSYIECTIFPILDSLLRIPGGLLNVARISSDLAIDRRTVDRYLDILQHRFLISLLPNLKAGAAHASRSRPKVHATDSALATGSLERAGADISSNPRKILAKVLLQGFSGQRDSVLPEFALATEKLKH